MIMIMDFGEYNLFSDDDIRKVLAGRNIAIPTHLIDLAAKEIGDRVMFLDGWDKDYYIVIDKIGRDDLIVVNPKNNCTVPVKFTQVKLKLL
jgi:hypothetical protein